MPSYTGAGHTFGSGGRSLGPATPPRAWSASMGRSAADARASVPPLAVRTPASPSSRLPPRYERNYGHHDGSDRDSEKSAPSAAAPAPAGAPAAGKATDKDADWRAMFRSSKGGTMGGGESTSGGGARAFRTAVETAYGRSKLYGSSSQADNKDRDANDKEACAALYAAVQAELEASLRYLLEQRKEDPYEAPLPRVAVEASWNFTKQVPTFAL